MKDSQEIVEKRADDTFRNLQLKIEYVQDFVKQEVLSLKKLSMDQNNNQDAKQEFERAVKNQLMDMGDVIAKQSKEIQRVINAEGDIKDYVQVRIEETEKVVKYNIDQLTSEMVKLSKETYYEFD